MKSCNWNEKKPYHWMFQNLNKVQNYVLLYLSLVNLCSEVPLGCVFEVLEVEEDWQQVDDNCDNVDDNCDDYWHSFSINSVVAVAPDSVSQDPFWLIRIVS